MSETNVNPEQRDYLPEPPKEEELGIGLTILAVLIPLAGAIMFFVYKGKEPKKSQQACYAALGGIVLGIILRVVMMA